jgi:hypothetical protein
MNTPCVTVCQQQRGSSEFITEFGWTLEEAFVIASDASEQ